MAIKSEKVSFRGSGGGNLAARLDTPEAPCAYALFAHCFTCTKDIFAAARIAAALAERGFAVLRFDFTTGLGHSEGEFANTNFSSNVGDLVLAAKFLKEDFEAPKLLIGHSLGGAAVLAAAPQLPEIEAVATIGAPADPQHVQHLFQDAVPEIRAAGEAEVLLAGRRFRIQRHFLEDIEHQKLEQALGSLRKALLVCHSPVDSTVGIENAGRIFAAAKHPKSFISLDRADHLLTRKEDAIYVAEVLAAWSGRYISGRRPQVPAKDPERSTDQVFVREAGEGPFAQDITIGQHRLRADEPESFGGKDSGPSPYDFVSAGLGACTAMTLRMFAGRKKWPLERVTVALNHDKIHASDCESCETEEGRIDRISRVIKMEGPLDGEQRQKLLEIADKCPVHRTLEGEILVTTSLEEEQ